jgi:signal transduction histidine kinase
LSRGALAEMRTLLMELRPSALLETGLDELVRQLGEAVTGRTGIPITVIVHGTCRLPEEVHIALYRIAQEALNNVVKHARASQVTLTLECVEGCEDEQSSVELRISDNGCGFNARHILPDHLGLGIMRERAQAIGATLHVISSPRQGTQVIVLWPAEEEEPDSEEFDLEEEWKGEPYEPVAVYARP